MVTEVFFRKKEITKLETRDKKDSLGKAFSMQIFVSRDLFFSSLTFFITPEKVETDIISFLSLPSAITDFEKPGVKKGDKSQTCTSQYNNKASSSR